jgi:hypothetical protein
MDRIIFGDNQFFGINHLSEEKGQSLAVRFARTEAVVDVIDAAYASGIHGLMLNTHDRATGLCEHFRAYPRRYVDLRLYPSMPYAHKYANAMNEKGMLGALAEFVFSGRSAGQAVGTILRGGMSLVHRDMIEVMRLLVDAELRAFRGLNVQVVFLQNIMTDLLLGLGVKEAFTEFHRHVRSICGAECGFITMNLPALVDFLLACGIDHPIVCSPINQSGFLMTPSQAACERTLAERPFRPMAMSIFASGAIAPKKAIEYVCGLPKIESIVFGASSRGHIEQTSDMIRHCWEIAEGPSEVVARVSHKASDVRIANDVRV